MVRPHTIVDDAPDALERWWRRRVGPIDADERAATMAAALRRQFTARLARHPERDPARTWRSLWNAGRRHWRAALAACDGAMTLNDLFGVSDGGGRGTARDAAAVCARLLVGWIRTVRGRDAPPTVAECVRYVGSAVRWLNTLGLSGWERVETAPPWTAVRDALDDLRFGWCGPGCSDFVPGRGCDHLREEPATGGRDGTAHRHATRARIDADGVRRLLGACGSPRDRAFVRLLASVALRIGAVAGLRWDDVWDDTRSSTTPDGAVRRRWEVVEKLGQIRVVVPRESLRRSLQRWRTSALHRRPAPVYVFEARAGRRPTERGLHKLLQRLCRRAGLPPVPPHAFRRYVVNEGIRRGASLAEMSRYLGHRGLSTTMRYYWTEDDAGPTMIRAMDAPSPPWETVSAAREEPDGTTEELTTPSVSGAAARGTLDGLIESLLSVDGGPD